MNEGKLISFAAVSEDRSSNRESEVRLAREREYSKQLREYAGQVASRLQKFETLAQAQSAKLRDYETAYRDACGKLGQANAELSRARNELERFQRGWTEALSRNRQELQANAAREAAEEIGRVRQRAEQERAREREHAERLVAEAERFARQAKDDAGRVMDLARSEAARLAERAKAGAEAEARAREEAERLRLGAERSRLEQDLQSRIEAEKARGETLLREEAISRERLLGALNEELRTRAEELAASRRETAASEEARRRLETELLKARAEIERRDRSVSEETMRRERLMAEVVARDSRITELERQIARLSAECELAFEWIAMDKAHLRALAERLAAEWENCDVALRKAISRDWIDTLLGLAEVAEWTAEPLEKNANQPGIAASAQDPTPHSRPPRRPESLSRGSVMRPDGRLGRSGC